ncbi:MAG: transcriptional regulator [Leptospiraceae bacterium]|nr:transcriptional regulator [Leptospiraceae bacterium]
MTSSKVNNLSSTEHKKVRTSNAIPKMNKRETGNSLDSLDHILDSKFLNSLSDSTRVSVLKKVIQLGRADVTLIAEGLPWDKSVVSRNLTFLNDAGVLKRTKVGKQVFYEPDVSNILKRFKDITAGIEMIINSCCPILPEK